MKLQLRLAFTTQPCPAFYKYHLSGLTEVGVRAEAGSLTQRAAVDKQTAQENRITVAPVRSAWAAVLSGAASSYILGLKLQFK